MPPITISPLVGRSMPVSILIKVDFPLPGLPMTATNSPRWTRTSILLRAFTGPVGVEYAFRRSRTEIKALLAPEQPSPACRRA